MNCCKATGGRTTDPELSGKDGRLQPWRGDAPPPMGAKFGVCCMFFVYLLTVPLLFAFLYYRFPGTVLVIIAILALCSFMPFCSSDIMIRGDVLLRQPVGPLLTASILASLAVAFLGGMRLYYVHIQPLHSLMATREYKGVYPQIPSAAFVDAGFLSFAGNTTVDTSNAVSMKSLETGFSTFCVAPVGNAMENRRVEFWAIGANCCGDSGWFECDDAGQRGAKNGLVVPNPHDFLFNFIGKYVAPPVVRRDMFMKALVKAEHTKQLVSGEAPVFLRWTSRSREEHITIAVKQLVVPLLWALVLGGAAAAGLTYIMLWWRSVRQERKFQRFGSEGMATPERTSEYVQTMNMFASDVMPSPRARVNEIFETWILVIAVPYLVLMLCMLLPSYMGCSRHANIVMAPFFALLGGFIIALLATPKRMVNGMIILLAAVAGLHFGITNYQTNMSHYCAVDERRSYTKVQATASGDEYADAGAMQFDASAQLSQKASVGFHYQDIMYCVAPIISKNPCAEPVPSSIVEENITSAHVELHYPSFLQQKARLRRSSALEVEEAPREDSDTEDTATQNDDVSMVADSPSKCQSASTRVEFWAIGTDCCGSRQDFHCDGAKDASAKSAVVVGATGGADANEQKHFHQAVAQAVSLNGLPVPEHTVFIRWGSDAKALQADWRNRAFGMVLFVGLTGFLTILCFGLCSHKYGRSTRAKERKKRAADDVRLPEAGLKKESSGFLSHARLPPGMTV